MQSVLPRRFVWKRECDQRIGNFGAEGSSASGRDNNKLFAGLFPR